jgi:outer membrane protein OmpA-like peptidoglycan-associated protein
MPRLAISTPDDPLEREADRIADAVTSSNSPLTQPLSITTARPDSVQRACACGGSSDADCTCEDNPAKNVDPERGEVPEEEEPEELEEPMFRIAEGSGEPSSAPPSVANVLSSSGEPLAESVRSELEPRFDYDFSGVRIHRDALAAASAAEVKALAYTVGTDIAFAAGQYAPETSAGRRVIAHELAHVVQQAGVSTSSPIVGRVSTYASRLLQRAGDPSAVRCDFACREAENTPANVWTSVFFEWKKADLSSEATSAIKTFAGIWDAAGADQPVRVDGYASVEGDPCFNWKLSCERATAVAVALNAGGIDSTLLEFFAQGATDEFPGGLPANRRATIAVDFGGPLESVPEEEEPEPGFTPAPEEPTRPERPPAPTTSRSGKSLWRVSAPSHPGWVSVKPTYLMFSSGEPFEFPHFMLVEENSASGSTMNVTTLEGRFQGSDAEMSSSDLMTPVAADPPATAKYDIAAGEFWYGSNGPIAATTDSTNPVPTGTHPIEVPDFSHRLGSSYGDFGTTWFRLGRSGDRYLHPGRVSLGCTTITDTTAWPDIWQYLVSARKDSRTVGELEVV